MLTINILASQILNLSYTGWLIINHNPKLGLVWGKFEICRVWSDWDISLYGHGHFFEEIPNLMVSLLYLSYLGSNIGIISVGL